MLVGFGLVGGALTILAVATPISLSGLMTALAAVRSFETNTRACAREGVRTPIPLRSMGLNGQLTPS